MKNYVRDGDRIPLIAPSGGVVGGNGYLIGTLFVVAVGSVAEDQPFEAQTTGVIALAKVSAQAWATVGAKIYWDNTAKLCTTVSTDNTLIGVVAKAAANPSATGDVRLGIVA